MILARNVINLLNHNTSTCIVGCLEFIVVNGGLRLICWGTWIVHILSFNDISYDVLEAYLMDNLMHSFGIWFDYILGHVVDKVIMLSHDLIYS